MYTISWEVEFNYELFETRKDNWPDTATHLPSDAASGEVDYYVTEEECCSEDENEQRSSEQANDVNENEIRLRPTNSRDMTSPLRESPSGIDNENDVNENEIRLRPANSRDTTSPISESSSGTQNKNHVTNDLEGSESVPNGDADITVPGISENEKTEENSSPREGKYNLRPNPNSIPNFSDEYRYLSEYWIIEPCLAVYPQRDMYFYKGHKQTWWRTI